MIQNFYEDFVLLGATSTSDGYGGMSVAYQDGAVISAAVGQTAMRETEIGERVGTKGEYIVNVPQDVTLHRNDRIRRVRDGMVLRITSEQTAPPTFSDLVFLSCTAEVVV